MINMLTEFSTTSISEIDPTRKELVRTRHGLQYIYRYIGRGPGPLFVSFPGLRKAGNPSVRVFQRTSWTRKLPCSFLFVGDPLWQVSQDMLASTFQGRPEYFVAEEVAEDIAAISEAGGHPEDRTLIYGSSIGGLPAMQAGTFLKQASVIVEAPQISLRGLEKHGGRTRQIVILASQMFYDVDTSAKIPRQFDHRLSAAAAFKARGEPAWLKIFVRRSDTNHLENHALPLVKEFPNTKLEIVDDTTGSGHTSLALSEVQPDICERLGLTLPQKREVSPAAVEEPSA